MAKPNTATATQAQRMDTKTGLTDADKDAIRQIQELEEAKQRVDEAGPSEGKKLFILQEIKIDQYTTLRRRVELTPSMCRAKGCGYDAAKEAGFPNGWNSVPHDQPLPDGRTLGEAVTGLLDYHTQTAHLIEHSHIMTEDEVKRGKQWSGVPGRFLTNPARA